MLSPWLFELVLFRAFKASVLNDGWEIWGIFILQRLTGIWVILFVFLFWGYRKIDIIYISKPVKRESFFLEQLQNKDRKLELWTLWLKSNCYFFFVPVLSLERAVQEIALLIYSWFDYIFSLPQSWYFGIIVPNYPSFSVKSLSEHQFRHILSLTSSS